MQRLFGRLIGALALLAAGAAAGEDQPPLAAKRSVAIDVVIVEIGRRDEFDGVRTDSAEAILARIAELESQGKSPGFSRVQLSTLEQQPAAVHAGQSATMLGARGAAAVRDREPPSAAGAVLTRQEFRTSVSATPLLEREGTILLELKVDSARPARGPGEPANRNGPVAASTRGTASVSFQSTLRLQPGQPQIAQSLETSSGGERSRTLVIVAAKTVAANQDQPGSAPAAETPEISLFRLHQLDVKAAARQLSELFPKRAMAYDEQLNVLAVFASKADVQAIRNVLKAFGELKD